LNPLALVLIYTVVFAQVMKARLPGIESGFSYGIYLCAGVLPWTLFAEILTRCQTMFIDNANLIKKSTFPRISLPVIIAGSAFLNFLIPFTLFLVFLLFIGAFPGISGLWTLGIVAIQGAFALGLGVLVGTLNVGLRDVGQLMSLLLSFWFWFTPIVYPYSILPEPIREAVEWNPMFPVTKAYQDIFLKGQFELDTLLAPAILALALVAFGFYVFRRNMNELADNL
jgi:lipopolysaccharide transport system permease protein